MSLCVSRALQRTVVVATALIAAWIFGCSKNQATPGGARPALGGAAAAGEVAVNGPVLRSRPFTPALGAFNTATRKGDKIRLDLFDDATFNGIVEVPPGEGRPVWSGRLEEQPGSWFTLANVEGSVTAHVRTDDGRGFVIRPTGGGQHVVEQFDPNLLPPCGVTDQQHVHVVGPALEPRETPETTVVDAMVVYTAAAENGAGGQAGMQSLILKCERETNDAYTNSNVALRIRVVHSHRVSYSDTGASSTDLDRLTGTVDGFMDEVHALRNQHKADVVVLIVESLDAGGLGWVMSTLNPTVFAPFAFNVCHRYSTAVSFVFAHECGHNMGLGHGVGTGGGVGIFPYSQGARFTSGGVLYKTIMAYRPGQETPHFSSPESIGPGKVPPGAADRDNARTLRETKQSVSTFRQ